MLNQKQMQNEVKSISGGKRFFHNLKRYANNYKHYESILNYYVLRWWRYALLYLHYFPHVL